MECCSGDLLKVVHHNPFPFGKQINLGLVQLTPSTPHTDLEVTNYRIISEILFLIYNWLKDTFQRGAEGDVLPI